MFWKNRDFGVSAIDIFFYGMYIIKAFGAKIPSD